MTAVEKRLLDNGYKIPECPVPIASYVPARVEGKYVYLSGQTSWVDGKLLYTGKVGRDLTLEEGYESAKYAALRCISELRSVADLDKVTIVKLNGYVNCDPEYTAQPKVILIDAGVGMDNEAIVREIERDGYRVEDIRYIVITHAHADHAGGVPYFAERSGAEILSTAHEAEVLADRELMESTMKDYIAVGFYPEKYCFEVIPSANALNDGDILELGNLKLKILEVPGHTGGCLCIYGEIDGKKTLICGDVVFFNGYINLISIFDVNLLSYKKSLLRLDELEIDTLLPGHRQPLMNRGKEAVTKAADAFRLYSVPPSIC